MSACSERAPSPFDASPVASVSLEDSEDADTPIPSEYTTLLSAVRDGDVARVSAALAAAKDIDLSAAIGRNATLLHVAAAAGHAPIARLLYDHGADVNVADESGATPLHVAASAGRTAVFTLLLNATPADDDVRDRRGATAREVAAANVRRCTAFTRRSRSVQLSTCDAAGRTALHVAAGAGHVNVVQALVAAGADLTALTSEGETALHLAATGGHASVVQLLTHVDDDDDDLKPGYAASGWSHGMLSLDLSRCRFITAVAMLTLLALAIVVFLGLYFGERVPELVKERDAALAALHPSEHIKEPGLWSYDRDPSVNNGPAYWGDIIDGTTGVPVYPACKGAAQSPVQLDPASALDANVAPLQRNVSATLFSIVTRPGGHPGFQVVPQNGVVSWWLDGERFDLMQVHHHSPSEHRIGGVQFPLEAHFVHRSPTSGTYAVFGIVYNISDTPNPFMEPFWLDIYRPLGNVSIDLLGLIGDVQPQYYRYTGSFTTPPCSEGVRWVVALSQLGVDAFQTYVYNYVVPEPNYRDVQALNNRTVTRFWRALRGSLQRQQRHRNDEHDDVIATC